jgi:hypothetical protein
MVARFPYQIVYRRRPTEIVIVAIAHLKRRPEYLEEARLIGESAHDAASAAAAQDRTSRRRLQTVLGFVPDYRSRQS